MLGFSPISTAPISALSGPSGRVGPVYATAEVGLVSLSTGVTFAVDGVVSEGLAGDLSPIAIANLTVSGVDVEGALGVPQLSASYNHTATSFELIGRLGLVDAQVSTNTEIFGVQAQGRIGGTTTWAQIKADAVVEWVDINI